MLFLFFGLDGYTMEPYKDIGNNVYDIGDPFTDLNNHSFFNANDTFTDIGYIPSLDINTFNIIKL